MVAQFGSLRFSEFHIQSQYQVGLYANEFPQNNCFNYISLHPGAIRRLLGVKKLTRADQCPLRTSFKGP